jgi:hypothetical protein
VKSHHLDTSPPVIYTANAINAEACRLRIDLTMTPLVAILEFGDYAVIAFIVLVFAGASSFAARQQLDLRRLERKLDALLKHQGVSLPSRLSPEVQCLAKDPNQKIAAIKLHREQNPGLGLAEAKAELEDFIKGS